MNTVTLTITPEQAPRVADWIRCQLSSMFEKAHRDVYDVADGRHWNATDFGDFQDRVVTHREWLDSVRWGGPQADVALTVPGDVAERLGRDIIQLAREDAEAMQMAIGEAILEQLDRAAREAPDTECQLCGAAPLYREDLCKRCDARMLGVNLAITQAAHEVLEAAIATAITRAHIDPRDVRTLVEKVIADTRPYGLRETWQEMHDRLQREHADEDVMT